jgi:hypothetical protein
MKLRAQIMIEVEAEDFLAAANHERAIQDIFRTLQSDYSSAQLEFREVRSKTPKDGVIGARKMRRYTGNLHQYAD